MKTRKLTSSQFQNARYDTKKRLTMYDEEGREHIWTEWLSQCKRAIGKVDFETISKYSNKSSVKGNNQ